MKNDSLAIWLTIQLKERGWSARELARRSHLSPPPINKAIAGEAHLSAKSCIKIANALNESPIMVLQIAGHIKPLPPAIIEENEIIRLIRELEPPARYVIITTLRSLHNLSPYIIKEQFTEYQASNAIIAQIIDALEAMTLDEQQAILDYIKKGDQ